MLSNFVYDKRNYFNPVNLQHVVGIYVPDIPSKKTGSYYIKFQTLNDNVLWMYPTKEERDFIYNNYLLPLFKFIEKD
jgi:hypothetical protein